jgi:aspartokinase
VATALGADRCELIKDVGGYYTADPHARADARPIAELSLTEAITMAKDGCDLVQLAALEAAAEAPLPLMVRSLDAQAPVTLVYAETIETEIAV